MQNTNILLLVLVVVAVIYYFYYLSSQSEKKDLKVEIFGDCNFNDSLGYLLPGDHNVDSLKNSVDSISSIKIPKGLKVDLFIEENFTGEKLTLTQDYPCFEGRFNDLVKSIKVSYL